MKEWILLIFFSFFAAAGMAYLQRKTVTWVPELKLPKKTGLSIPMTFLMCMYLFRTFLIGQALFFLTAVIGLLFSAYTDWHRKQLICIVPMISGSFGFTVMWIFESVRNISICYLGFLLVDGVVCWLLSKIHVFQPGDAKLLFSTFPYLMVFSSVLSDSWMCGVFISLCFLCVCWMYAIIFAVVYRIRHKEKTFPFAPAISAGFCSVLYFLTGIN